MDPIISIIIPVYNVEEYLNECIQSIKKQLTEQCEVIIVDDGSTDHSGIICDSFSSFQGFKIIHKKNGGLGSARNVGLEIATGKYVCFLDSDDRLCDNSITQLISRLVNQDYDMCFMQAIKFYPDGRKEDLGDNIKEEDFNNKSKDEIIKFLSTRNKYPGSSCTKVFRLSFLKENDIWFSWEKVYAEDLIFTLKAIYSAETYCSFNFGYYEYRQNRKDSITNSTTKKSLDGLAKFLNDSIALLCVNKKPVSSIARYLLSYVAYEYAILLHAYSKYDGDKKMYKLFLKDKKWVLKYSNSKPTRIIRFLVFIFGISFSSRILKLLKH